MFARQPLADRIQARLCLPQRNARPQSRDGAESVAHWIRDFVAGLPLREPQVGPRGQFEIGRQYTGNTERSPLQLNRRSDELRIGIEIIAP